MERMKNRVRVSLIVDSDCKVSEGEYSLYLLSSLSSLNIDPGPANNDIELIREAVEESLPGTDDDEFQMIYELVESGEWEDVHFNKYFEVVSSHREDFK